MTLLKNTAYASLLVQFLTGIADIWGLTIQVSEQFQIFKQLLTIELGVQIVEFIYYIWMTLNIDKKKNITIYRYFDWFITTPLMLLTLMVYLENNSEYPISSVIEFVKKYKSIVAIVIFLNFLMLLFGLFGELGWINPRTSALIGFIPFALYYLIIYRAFVYQKPISNQKRNVYFYFLFVWLLYGVAALLPYIYKNSMYNILDLFAKNFFGLFLVYIIYSNRQKD
jgi:hypothetical protein